MSKNWKRKLRKITVDEKEYHWLVKGEWENAFEERIIGVRIYEGKDLLIEDDYYADRVTPGMIADLIKEIQSMQCQIERG